MKFRQMLLVPLRDPDTEARASQNSRIMGAGQYADLVFTYYKDLNPMVVKARNPDIGLLQGDKISWLELEKLLKEGVGK